MKQKFTVVWRPSGDAAFRLDHVLADSTNQAIMEAAAQAVIDEYEYAEDDAPDTVENVLNGYEGIAIFDGHLVESKRLLVTL